MIDVEYYFRKGWKPKRPQDYQCERIEVGGHILVRNGKEALSRQQWADKGYVVNQNVKTPHATLLVGEGRIEQAIDVYRDDQVHRRVQLPWAVLGMSVLIGVMLGFIIGITVMR